MSGAEDFNQRHDASLSSFKAMPEMAVRKVRVE